MFLCTGRDPGSVPHRASKALYRRTSSSDVVGRDLQAPLAMVGALEGHIRAVTALVYSQSNGVLWSASEDGTIKIWNLATNACVHTITGTRVIRMFEKI